LFLSNTKAFLIYLRGSDRETNLSFGNTKKPFLVVFFLIIKERKILEYFYAYKKLKLHSFNANLEMGSISVKDLNDLLCEGNKEFNLFMQKTKNFLY